MGALTGLLNINDTDRTYVSTLGQAVVYDNIIKILHQHEEDLAPLASIFIERDTEDHAMRYKLPGGGKLQRTGRQAPAGAVKRGGQWDVGFSLEGFGAQFGGSRVDMAYMTIQEIDRHLDSVMIQNANTLRWEILHAIFDNVNLTFVDFLHGSITVRRLANEGTEAAGVLYPPVIGSETEATEDHYLESGYTVANISAVNMPLKTVRDELVEHFGGISTGGDPILYIATPTIADKLKSICGAAGTWYDVPDVYTKPGVDADLMLPRGMPNAPGYCVGRAHGCWVFAWEWMPATYSIGIHLGAKAPLLRRVDPADTGLLAGLHLVTQDENYPLISSYYENRYGLGCGNRLSAVVMEIAAGGSYTIPADYD